MKSSNTLRWGMVLTVILVAGAAYWFWHDRSEETTAGAAGASQQGAKAPAGARHGRFGAALAPVQAATADRKSVV